MEEWETNCVLIFNEDFDGLRTNIAPSSATYLSGVISCTETTRNKQRNRPWLHSIILTGPTYSRCPYSLCTPFLGKENKSAHTFLVTVPGCLQRSSRLDRTKLQTMTKAPEALHSMEKHIAIHSDVTIVTVMYVKCSVGPSKGMGKRKSTWINFRGHYKSD